MLAMRYRADALKERGPWGEVGDIEESGSAFQARCQASMANSMLPREMFGSAVRSLRRVQSWEQMALIMMKEPKCE